MARPLFFAALLSVAVGEGYQRSLDDFELDAPRLMRAPHVKAVHTVAPNDPALFYSPYNWAVTPTAASSINGGAYIRALFQSSFANLTFDCSNMVSPVSQLYIQVDNGPMTLAPISPVIPVEIPANLTHGDVPWHTLTVLIKSTTETANRWAATGASTRVTFLGLVIDGSVAPWYPASANILIYGDSITEGVLTLGGSQPQDTNHNDASVVYSYRLAALLGAEIGVVGFGATGLSRGGSGGVPALGESWNQLWEGVPRSFSPRPDLIVLNEGTNDGTTDIVAAMAAVLSNLTAACPGTPIAVLRPFNGAQAANLQAAIAASANPAASTYIDTAGFYDETFGGALHPTGPNDVARVAPQVAARLRPLLARGVIAAAEGGAGL